MVFSSIVFLFYFLPLFFAAFYLIRFRPIVILPFSLLFYAWGEPFYVFLIITSMVVNFVMARLIERASASGCDKLVLTVGIVLNLLPLLIFKYTDLIATSLASAFWRAQSGSLFSLALPLGISFYTFHSISYLVDVYRKDAVPERSFVNLAIYISMFPQLIAGPIIRYKTIAGDLHHPVITLENTRNGIQFFILGLAQKVLLANTLAAPADLVFGLPPEHLSTVGAWIGILSYTLQIYFDFGGYSMMAIGLGLMIGYRYPRNFNYPYVSQSITEFWRRWHMTLSAWFRDYVYIPLGGNRVSRVRTHVNLVVVFLLCGLWHGAAWTFVIWGLFHGFFLVLERSGFGEVLKRLPTVLRTLYALVVVMVGWVLFRATDLTQAGHYLRAMGGFGAPYEMGLPAARLLHPDVVLALAGGAILSTPIFQLARNSFPAVGASWLANIAGTAVSLLLLLAVAASLAGGAYNPFIYFRF